MTPSTPSIPSTRGRHNVPPNSHHNSVRETGVDRCYCGCKYWGHDACVDCGGTEPEES